MITLTTANNALQSFYLDAVAHQLNMEINPFLAQVKQHTADVYGKDVKKVVRYGISGGIGAGSEDGTLPTAGNGNYLVFTSALKNLFGSIRITDKAIKASATDESSFVNLLNEEMEHLVKSASYNFGRMLFGDGTGTLATVSAASMGKLTVDSTKNIDEGMIVDVHSASGSAIVSGKRITAIDRDNNYVTIEGSYSTDSLSSASFITLQNSYNMELTGLGAIFSTSALYGLSRSSSACMTPYSKASVGAISENVIQTAIDTIDERSGSKVNFIICSYGVKRALAEVLSSSRRSLDTMELNGGYIAMNFNGIPVVADRFCPEGTMYLLNTDDFGLYQLGDWDWLRGDDGGILKQIAGSPVFEATLAKYADLMCVRPCGQGMLSGITEA